MPELRFFWDYMAEQVDRIRRVVALLERRKVRYALVGGHAVSFHARPRVTVDVDFLVPARALPGLEKALAAEGFVALRRGEIVRAWEKGMNPAKDEPVVDLVPAEASRTQEEALRGAKVVRYQNLRVRIAGRPAVVALKFLAATSVHRDVGDKAQDVADIAHIVAASWSPGDLAEARRLLALSSPPAADELERLIDDLRHGRRITI